LADDVENGFVEGLNVEQAPPLVLPVGYLIAATPRLVSPSTLNGLRLLWLCAAC
jgi:hypothetical protein